MSFIDEIHDPWIDPKDMLDRKKYADYLTNYLGKLNEPFVLNVNAYWGLGKTFFLQSWAKSIADQHLVVYINAWENDFSDDPLLTILSNIKTQLSEHLTDKTKAESAISSVYKSSGRFIKKIAPIIAEGLIRKALGNEATNDLSSIQINDPIEESVGDIAHESTKILLDDHEANSRNMEDFRNALQTLLGNVLEDSKKNPPVYIFIDELDRCRPTYAIELLENVKHLFSVSKTVFVIATDSAQLQHSVCAIYGNSFDGAEYLRRFFDREFSLPIPSYIQLARMLFKSFEGYDSFLDSPFIPQHRNGKEPASFDDPYVNICNWIDFYAKSFKISIRSLIQAHDHLMIILANSEGKTWHPSFLLFLLFLYTTKRKEFDTIESAIKSYNNSSELFALIPESSETIHWLYHNDIDKVNGVNKFITAKDIGQSIITVLPKLLAIKPQSYLNNGMYPNTIDNFIALCMYNQHTENRYKEVNFIDYFDAIRMAGFIVQ
ncbi:MAG: KAP family NTPase [Candidatus Thiodiazotropha sp. (ex Clathrolucina costata)]|nr:KAP family NTPase [Candidatus Thiodiazotropha taylori]